MAVFQTVFDGANPPAPITVELTPARVRARGLSTENVIGVNLSNPPRVRAVAKAVTVSADIVTGSGSPRVRARVVMPSIGRVTNWTGPAGLAVRARAVSVQVSAGLDVELTPARVRVRSRSGIFGVETDVEQQPARVRARAVMPQVALGANITAAGVPNVRGRAVMPVFTGSFDVELTPARVHVRGQSLPAPALPAVVPGPLLGGFAITSVEEIGPAAIRVGFKTSYGNRYRYQLYGGRCLIGATSNESTRAIRGSLLPSEWPVPLQIVAVDKGDEFNDYGHVLPPRPYNRVSITFTALGFPADARWLDVTGSAAAGEAVDDDNLLARYEYDTDRAYTLTTDPLPGSGLWSFEAFGRDNKLTGGNKGDVLALSQEIDAIPPDVVADETTGRRLTGSVADQALAIAFTYPTL